MHTRLFGVCLTYVLVFTALMNIAGLASFPPSAFDMSINFSNLIFWLPDVAVTVEFSWSNIMIAIFTLTLTVLVGCIIFSMVTQSFDMDYAVKIILGTSISLAIGTTMISTVGDLMPSWLHLFLIYLPCGLLIYSVLAIGEG